MNATTTTLPAIAAGTKLVVVKGCQARSLWKGDRFTVVEVIPGERGSARIRLRHWGRSVGAPDSVISFYVQFAKWLTKDVVGMNDGNPMHRIEVRRA